MLNAQEVRLNELYISSKPTYDGVKVRNKVREVTARILPLPESDLLQKGMEFEGSPMKSIFSASSDDINLPKNFLLECSQDNLELLFVFLPKDEDRARYLCAWLKYSCERVWGFAS
nr:protein argonaute MEL1 [Tanacetum cinerariifolium]